MRSSKVSAYLRKIYKESQYIKNLHEAKNLLIAFRGESKDYGDTALMPSLFRNPEFPLKEKHMFELIEDYGLGKGEVSSNLEKLMEVQHYIAISRLLDISFNALVALYFACSSEKNKECDGFIYVFGFPEHYSPHSNYLETFYSNVLEGKQNLAYARNFKVISHSYSNDRIKAQHGGFILFPGNEFHSINQIYYRKITIKKEYKAQILDELDSIFQIRKETLFPEIESLASIIENKFKSDSFYEREVSLESEIEMFLKRVEYEITAMKREHTYNRTYLNRKLRKEQSDVCCFVNSLLHINDKMSQIEQSERKRCREKLIQQIEKEFDVIKKLL